MKTTGIAFLASALVNIVFLGFVGGGSVSQDGSKTTVDVIRTRKLEIVNSKGEAKVIAAIASRHHPPLRQKRTEPLHKLCAKEKAPSKALP